MASNKTEIEIDGKNTGAIVSINGVKKELRDLGDYVGGPFGAAMNTLSKHLAFAGVAAGIGGLVAITKQAINTADELYKMSQRTGVSVESLSTLKYAADLSDLSMEQLETSLKKLSINLYDVAHGQGKDAAEAFNELGLNIFDSSHKLRVTENIFSDIAEKFSLMGDGAKKTAISVKLFGKAGIDTIPFLNQGKDGIKTLTDEAKKLGAEVSTGFAQKAEAFNDNLKAMEYMTRGIGITIAEQLMPTLFSLSGSLKTFVTDSEVATNSGSAFAIVLKSIATILGGVYAGAYTAGSALGTFGAAAATLISTGSFEQAGHVFELGWANIEKASKSFGNSFNTLWSDNTAELDAFMKKVHQLTGNENNVLEPIKKLKDEFAKLVETSLKPDRQKAIMAPELSAIIDLNVKAAELKLKYAAIPGALKEISIWYDTMLIKASKTNEVSPKGLYDPLTESLKKLKNENIAPFDMTGIITIQPPPFAGWVSDAVNFFDIYDERAEQMRQMTGEMFGNMGGMAETFFQIGGQKSKEMFALYKTFAIAQATISGYEAVMHSYKEGAKYGGPILGAVFAATAAAFSIAQIAKISSAQMGGSGNASGGGSISAGGSNLSQPSNLSNAAGNYNPGQNVTYNIIVNGNIVDQNRFARELVPAINRAISDGVS